MAISNDAALLGGAARYVVGGGAVLGAVDVGSVEAVGLAGPRTKRWVSSASSSLSSSKASASVESTCWSRDDSEEDLEWKDGGGELGIACACRCPRAIGVSGSSSSRLLTCERNVLAEAHLLLH